MQACWTESWNLPIISWWSMMAPQIPHHKYFRNYPQLHLITFPENRGKGDALKTGFLEAENLGYSYVITMDSDGQHYPDDLPVFLDALKNKKPSDPELLVIGSRKMDSPDVPEKSSFGNRCSTFWFRVETGIDLQDTQCGYGFILSKRSINWSFLLRSLNWRSRCS